MESLHSNSQGAGQGKTGQVQAEGRDARHRPLTVPSWVKGNSYCRTLAAQPGTALKWLQAHLALEAVMSLKGIVFVVVLFVLILGAALVRRPTTKPAHWTVVEVRYLKNGDCAFVAEWSAGLFSVPEYVKAESKDSLHSLCPELGDILNPPRLDMMTISAGTGDAQRFADVIEQWRGQDINPR